MLKPRQPRKHREQSALARREKQERRRKPLVVQYRVTWTEEQERRARSVPARQVWKPPAKPLYPAPTAAQILGGDPASFYEAVRDILENAPIRRVRRTRLVRDAETTAIFRELAGLLLTTRAYHNWLIREGRLADAPLLKQSAELRLSLKKARARLRQAVHAGAKEETLLRAQRDAWKTSLKYQAAKEELNTRRSGLPKPPTHHRLPLKHAAAIGILHHLYHDFGLPDSTIAALIKAVGLPELSPRTIKRYRTSYCRP